MSDGGNGVTAAVACPVNPTVRPAECNAIHGALQEIRREQKRQGDLLEVVVTTVSNLAVAHGQKPPKMRGRR